MYASCLETGGVTISICNSNLYLGPSSLVLNYNEDLSSRTNIITKKTLCLLTMSTTRSITGTDQYHKTTANSSNDYSTQCIGQYIFSIKRCIIAYHTIEDRIKERLQVCLEISLSNTFGNMWQLKYS